MGLKVCWLFIALLLGYWVWLEFYLREITKEPLLTNTKLWGECTSLARKKLGYREPPGGHAADTVEIFGLDARTAFSELVPSGMSLEVVSIENMRTFYGENCDSFALIMKGTIEGPLTVRIGSRQFTHFTQMDDAKAKFRFTRIGDARPEEKGSIATSIIFDRVGRNPASLSPIDSGGRYCDFYFEALTDAAGPDKACAIWCR